MLPHRYPFLLVDRIMDIRGDEHGIGIKNVTINEPHFMGHFPNNPVMPGVLVLEGMAQTGGMLAIRSRPARAKPKLVYFLTIDKAKFRKPVMPGDVLEYHMDRIARAAKHVVVPRRGQGRRRDRRRGRTRRHDRRGLSVPRIDPTRARGRRRAACRRRRDRPVLRRRSATSS